MDSTLIFQFLYYQIIKGGKLIINTFYENQITAIDKEILSIDKKLSQYPAGELNVYDNNGSYRWYLTEERKRVYLSKKARTIAEIYTQKKYLQLKKNKLLEKREIVFNRSVERDSAAIELEEFLNNDGYISLLGYKKQRI